MFEKISFRYNEKGIQNSICQDTDIPAVVHEKINAAYRSIGVQSATWHSAPEVPLAWLRAGGKAAGGIAAVFAVGLTVCAANPAMAQELPIVGSVFELLQDKVSFFGNLSDHAVTLEEPIRPKAESNDAVASDSVSESSASEALYTRTADGLTISFSEVYANSQTVYLGMTIQSDEAFPDTLINQEDNPCISIIADSSLSFMENTETDTNYFITEGKFLNKNTYVCILRYDLASYAKDYTEYYEKYDEAQQQILDEMGVTLDQLNDETDEGKALLGEYIEKLSAQQGSLQSYIKDVEIPDSFTLHLDFSRIIGDKADPDKVDVTSENYSIPNESENYWFDGSWTFDIPITVDDSQTEVQELNDTNDTGIGLRSVTKSPYEISFEELYTDGSDSDTFLVALDADGNKLPYVESADSTKTFAIQDRDISTIDVYILDYSQYMDELKSQDNYTNNETKPEGEKWSDLLGQHALYHTTLHF